MTKGRHLMIDCQDVQPSLCIDDKKVLEVMARAADRAGANVISQVRYRFGHDSPPGFTAMILLDESHCSAHCYADTRQIAIDVFTCGDTDPHLLWEYMNEELKIQRVTITEFARFQSDAPENWDVISERPGLT